jgi:hypothetical protein
VLVQPIRQVPDHSQNRTSLRYRSKVPNVKEPACEHSHGLIKPAVKYLAHAVDKQRIHSYDHQEKHRPPNVEDLDKQVKKN